MKYVTVLMIGLLAGTVFATPDIYFADVSGNQITSLTAAAGDVTLYIYGQTDTGNVYDALNIGLAYDPTYITPKTGTAASDLVIGGPFGAGFGYQETTYDGTSIICGGAAAMTTPAGFGPTLLATAHFTFSGTETEISMFNEADEYTYSTFLMNTSDLSDVRFSDTLTINSVPEPATISLICMGLLAIARKRRNV